MSGVLVNSLGVEQIQGPYSVTAETERQLERANFGFIEYMRIPFDASGLVVPASTSIDQIEFGKGTVFLSADLIVETVDATETMDVGLILADNARTGDTFTTDVDALVATGSVATAGIVNGSGASIGVATSGRTKLTAAMSAGTDTAAGYILLKFIGGVDYFDNI